MANPTEGVLPSGSSGVKKPVTESGEKAEPYRDRHSGAKKQTTNIFAKTTNKIAGYVGREYRYGANTGLAVEHMFLPTLVPPADPAKDASVTLQHIWGKEVDEYVKQKSYLNQNMKTLYAL
eukprot:scaffold13054_cov70-Attheya_sp.AAC.3